MVSAIDGHWFQISGIPNIGLDLFEGGLTNRCGLAALSGGHRPRHIDTTRFPVVRGPRTTNHRADRRSAVLPIGLAALQRRLRGETPLFYPIKTI